MKTTKTKKPKPPRSLADRLGEKLAFTCADVGEFLGVHPSTVRRWINAGTLAAMDLPGDKRISRATVERLLGMTEQPAN